MAVGRDVRWSFPAFVSVRNFTVEERLDPILVPLTARGMDSAFIVVVVFERLIINWSLLVKRSILIGGKRGLGSAFCIFVFVVVAER